jgi:hypothetical protein
MSDFVDEIVHISIHKDDIKRQPKRIQKFIDEFRNIEFYESGLRKGKKLNKVAEFKRLIKELKKVRDKNKGEESNVECIVYDQMIELLGRMMLKDLRKLNLDKLL